MPLSDIKRVPLANVAAGQTDSALVTAVAGARIRVMSLVASCAATATAFTLNSKPAGSGVAISPLITNAINDKTVLPHNPGGWFETAVGEGLTVTTGAGATAGFTLTYVEVT